MRIPSGIYLQDFAVDEYEDDFGQAAQSNMVGITEDIEFLGLPTFFPTVFQGSDALMALSMTIEEVARGGLSEGQSVNNAMIRSIGAVDADEVDNLGRLHNEGENKRADNFVTNAVAMDDHDDMKFDDNGHEYDFDGRRLQELNLGDATDDEIAKLGLPTFFPTLFPTPVFRWVQYDLVLDELCGSMRCEVLADTTTMYENVTTHMSQEAENGGFDATLQENLMECGEGCDDLVNASIANVTFDEEDIEVITSMPTAAPTLTQ